ncbi:MAG TPA: carboxypeptidase-like regulatory domain-containing protein [Blastocatellia bacterium]|nr:carboxypeptidase-like regulatory domain-containing protein [Blastocatellia bacterium]
MPGINFTALVLIPLLAWPVELSSQSREKEIPRRAAEVSGRVTFKGEPLSGATVSIRPENMTGSLDPKSILRGRTDQNGKYRISGLAGGRYSISAAAPGFGLSTDYHSTDLTITDGTDVENLDFELKRGGVITGRVTDSNNRPVVGVPVELMRFYRGQAAPLMRDSSSGGTDDRGVYRFYGVPAGRYLVNVGVSPAGGAAGMRSASSYLPRTFHPNATEQSEAKVIEVGEGTEAAGVDIAVAAAKKTYQIQGRVRSAEDGQPMAGINLLCAYFSGERQEITNWGPSGVRSDANGEFRLQGLLPGRLKLFADFNRESELFSEVEVCEIRDQDLQGIEIKVKSGGTISGQIVIEDTNDPEARSKISELQLYATVWTGAWSPPGMGMIKVNPDGSFRIKGLRPGKVRISTPTPSYRFAILRFERNGVSSSPHHLIEIGPGQNISEVRVIVGYANSAIQGEVKIIGGTVPANLDLYVHARSMGDPHAISILAKTDARRQFVFGNLLPGEYELYLSPIYGSQVDRQFSAAISKVRRKVIVGPNSQPTVSLEIDLAQQAGNQ